MFENLKKKWWVILVLANWQSISIGLAVIAGIFAVLLGAGFAFRACANFRQKQTEKHGERANTHQINGAILQGEGARIDLEGNRAINAIENQRKENNEEIKNINSNLQRIDSIHGNRNTSAGEFEQLANRAKQRRQ